MRQDTMGEVGDGHDQTSTMFGEVIVRREENRDKKDGSVENDEIHAMKG